MSSDRRSQSEQDTNKFMVLGLTAYNGRDNKLAKLYFDSKTYSRKQLAGELVGDELCRCHTVRDNLVVAFHKQSARLYDDDLVCKHQVQWNDSLPVQVK